MRISNIISNFLHKSRIKSEKSLPILKNEGQSLCQDCVEIGVESGYFVPRKLFFTGMCTGYWLVVWWNTLMDWQWVKGWGRIHLLVVASESVYRYFIVLLPCVVRRVRELRQPA